MKKLKNVILIVIAGTYVSCSDFLDKQPLDQLSSATFWETEKDMKMALAGVYQRLQSVEPIAGMQFSSSLAHWDALTDNGWALNSFEGGFQLIAKGEIVSTSSLPHILWSGCYRGISACNIFIANAESQNSIDRTLISKYIAEVKFLRAFYYYWLTESFGGVPLFQEPIDLQNMTRPRSTKEQVLEKIDEDLDYAIAHLPNIAYDGHAIKGAALALKARIKLFNGDYAQAASFSKQVIDDKLFSLAEDYRSNFIIDFGQDDCPEIIFSIKYLAPVNTQNTGGNLNWGGSVQPLFEFVDSHEPGDIRKTANILSPGDPWPMKEPGAIFSGDGLFAITGYGVNKYHSPSFNLANASIGRGDDIPHLRYAEVLLVYAEAENELVGPSNDVYDAINQVRKRANLENLPAGLSKEQMREHIRHERRVELAFEGQRYFDLKRWGIAADIIPTIFDPPNNTVSLRVWNNHFNLLPIPQSEIDKNPNLEQNPGY